MTISETLVGFLIVFLRPLVDAALREHDVLVREISKISRTRDMDPSAALSWYLHAVSETTVAQ